MHLDNEGAVAKAVTSLLGRPAEWAHGQLSLNSNCFPDLDTFFAALKAFLAPPDSDFRNRTLFHKSVRGKLSIRDYANRLRYIYTLMIDRDSLNEATPVSVFMNGLVESLLRSELFHRIPKTFEEAVEIALKEEFSQASAQGKSAGSDQWDMEVSSMEQFPQREAYRVPASAPPSQRPCFECNQLAARLSTPQEHAPPTTSEDALPSACASKTSAVAASLWKIPWLEGRPEPRLAPTGRDKAFPFDDGGSGGIASGTLLCQLGQSSRMLSFEMSIAGFSRPLKVLIDCGASENHARRETIASSKAMLDRATSDQASHAKVRVKLANGQVIVTDRVLITQPTKIGPFDSEETFFVIDLDDRWDLILGMRWLEKHKPTIDWCSKTLSAPSSSDDTPLGVMSNELTPSSDLKTQLNTRSRRTIEESIDDDVLEYNSIHAVSATTEASGELAETRNVSVLYDSVAITARNTARNKVMFQELEGFGISHDGITKIYASHDAKRRRLRMARAAAWSQTLAEETILPARVADTAVRLTADELILSHCDLEELPRVGEEIVKLPEMSFREFKRAIRSGDIVSIALIQPVDELELNTSSTLDTEVASGKTASYLHKFSENFASIARPLSTLLSKDEPWNWTQDCQAAFDGIKASLVSAPILALPRFDRPFSVVCDGPVSFQSRQLRAAERNYPVHDLELLAIKYVLVKFRIYLLGSKPFVVYTDHASLRYAVKTPHISEHMAPWFSFFAEYNVTVEYKPGRENVFADALSRRPANLGPETTELSVVYHVHSDLYDRIRRGYRNDPAMKAIMAQLSGTTSRSGPTSTLERYSIRDGLLFHQLTRTTTPRVAVPCDADLCSELVKEFHDTPSGGHLGRDKTHVTLARSFW
ncbi:hypothetical protein Ae201684_001343 [Aphanomyces euteiches]|uniref:RNA-directed DNA polymerase n=1 Tax=Aphanomyces euteiches TaxID=100861 RepID=A0A6G0XTW7_9STRA|nr:hypothetical protein Ae201684_001343 [Aphanomyces euteiches]KAH9151343.1 hypothetical protein AeRB84_006021 [Aphanomyces euteiches]